ncbi:MAG: tetratricopeptide repeat protein, partial [Candidatus Wildermuthbacteria bacterium]|nr:tetratricopeptide repeat protein [Candidatus Wildermuthbacteria bacterium]
ALFFAVHPANAESVAYIASIGEVLFTFFILLAFLAVLKRSMWAFFALTFLGLLAKETAVVILPIVLLYFFIFKKPKPSFYLQFAGGSFGILSVYFFLRFFIGRIPLEQFHLTPIGQASFLQRVFTFPLEIFVYLKTLFFPLYLAIYQNFVVQSVSDIRFWGVSLFLLLLALLVGVFLKRQNGESRKLYLFGIVWFFIGLFPVSNLVFALDMTVAERWLYFPAMGFYVFLSLLIVQILRVLKGMPRKAFVVFIAGAFLALSARTIVRNFDWRNDISLYSHDIQYSKNSFELENNYGKALYLAGKTGEAEAHFQKALVLEPNSPQVYNNFGAMLFEEGNYEQAEIQFRKAVALRDLYSAYENLAVVLFESGKLDEAELFIRDALLKFPDNPKLNLILAVIYYQEEKPKAEIMPLLSKTLASDPANEDAKKLYNLIQ